MVFYSYARCCIKKTKTHTTVTATNTNSDLCFSLLVCPSQDRDSKNNHLYLKLCYAFHQEIPCSEKGKFTEINFLSFFLCFPPPLFLASSGQHCLFLPPLFPVSWGLGFPPFFLGAVPEVLPSSPQGAQHTSPSDTPRCWLWGCTDKGGKISSSDFWGAQEEGSSSLLTSPMISRSPATHQFYRAWDNPVLLTKVRLAHSCFRSRCGGVCPGCCAWWHNTPCTPGTRPPVPAHKHRGLLALENQTAYTRVAFSETLLFWFFLLEIQPVVWKMHPTLLHAWRLTSPSLLLLPGRQHFTRKGNNHTWIWPKSIFPHVILTAEEMVSCNLRQPPPTPPQLLREAARPAASRAASWGRSLWPEPGRGYKRLVARQRSS